jgi:hypothetical protein
MAGEMPDMLARLSAATGYAPEMLTTALAGAALVGPPSLAAAMDFRPTWAAASGWVTNPRLGGRIRFFPNGLAGRARAVLTPDAALFRPAPQVDLTLGFAAGNVPGTALIIALLGGLAGHAASGRTRAPAVLVRNSRHEPLFTPWVLSAVAPLPMPDRQALLESDDTEERLILVTDLLRAELRSMNVVPSLPATEVARTRWSPN